MVQDDISDEEKYVEDTVDDQKVFGLNAEDQYDHIFRVLEEYGYTDEQLASMEKIVKFITGDNCATNRSMCKRTDILFVELQIASSKPGYSELYRTRSKGRQKARS